MAIHLANVWLAGQYKGDPCTWYLINFLLDSSMGLLIIFIGIRFCQYLSRKKAWEAINFGEYGKPPSTNAWLAQCCLYVSLMAIVKVSITLFMQLDFWEGVKDFILSPINNPKVELAFVMLIIPFFVNVSCVTICGMMIMKMYIFCRCWCFGSLIIFWCINVTIKDTCVKTVSKAVFWHEQKWNIVQ